MEEKNNVEETTKKKSKLPVIITAIVLVVVLIAAIGGYFGYQYIEENKTTGTEWGDTYYTYLKAATNKESNKEDYGLKDNMENTKLQFIEVGETNPIMVMTYDYEGDSFVNIYRTKEENKVDKIIHKEPATIEFLYHIESKSYSWYIHEKNETQNSYKKIYTILENPEDNKKAEYTIAEGEETKQDTLSGGGEPITLSKFDEIFVKPEVEPSKKIDFNEDIEAKDLKKEITTGVEEYKPQEELVTEVKSQIEETLKKLDETKKAIEAAKEEIRLEEERKAEEARKKAEEEAKKKAEEEAKKKISEEEAKKLAQKIDGTYADETGFPIGYSLEAMVKDSSGLEYYLFRVRWLVENSHWSTIDGVAISVNGKKWKQVDIYQNYQNGQTIKEVYKEGNF